MKLDRIVEVRKALMALGYPRGMMFTSAMLDADRCLVCKGQEIVGIYDFARHTFVD